MLENIPLPDEPISSEESDKEEINKHNKLSEFISYFGDLTVSILVSLDLDKNNKKYKMDSNDV